MLDPVTRVAVDHAVAFDDFRCVEMTADNSVAALASGVVNE
jgi:hypothetical protein